MRIWHEELIPKLCRQHLLAVWRESLGCWSILVNDKKGYRNHPAVKEFEKNHLALAHRLSIIRKEMLSRGYNPKLLPFKAQDKILWELDVTEWQSLEEQIEVLKAKGCNCKI